MCLIDDRKNVVRSLNGVSYKSGVFDDENMVLRVRNDSSLVLWYLYDGQTLELNDGVGDYLIENELI